MAAEGAPKVEIKTSIGTFVVELYIRHAPKTCKNFLELSRRGYYNNTTVLNFVSCCCLPLDYQEIPGTESLSISQMHRIIRDFMIQMGDPTGTGRGGESIYGGKFEASGLL
jgi:peptidyl-prolyl cis-trans isomerase-like 1